MRSLEEGECVAETNSLSLHIDIYLSNHAHFQCNKGPLSRWHHIINKSQQTLDMVSALRKAITHLGSLLGASWDFTDWTLPSIP